MQNKQDYYSVADYGDRLKPGESLKIEHTLSFSTEKADISELAALPLEKLTSLRDKSIEMETAVFNALLGSAKAWEPHAAYTTLINKAIEYARTPACEHTANKWVADEEGYHSMSNMTYKMTWHVYEQTKYVREKGASEPVAWDLTWSVCTNRRGNDYYSNTAKIAGQERKRFTDKTVMEKYLQGRIKAYSHLFTEISPPVPLEYAKHFKVNGLLLPGYTMAEDSIKQTEHASSAEKPSVLERIAEAREEQRRVKPDSRDNAAPVKSKSTEPEH